MRRLTGISAVFFISLAFGADKSTNTDVVSAADDAFGITLGPESLGLYNAASVRGFSPLTAGNVRLDGLYFDQQGGMIDRLVTHTRIRVGLSAVDFPWPAPTGIVDYTLREPRDTPGLTSISYLGPYNSRDLDLDGSTNLLEKHLGIAAGVSYHSDEYIPGYTAHLASLAILPRWTPNKEFTLAAFWGRQNTTSDETFPAIYLSAGQSPPHFPVRFFGQAWTVADFYSEHYGLLLYAKLSGSWVVRAGLFRSIYDSPRSYADLYENTSSEGVSSEHSIIAEPNQYYGSTSGEIQFTGTFIRGMWRQKLDVGVRGRDVNARYGGSESFDFGTGLAGQPQPLNRPDFHFGATTSDHISEYSPEASYSLQWNGRVSLTSAIRRPNYSRNVQDPNLGNSTSSISPWLYNSSLVVLPTTTLALFGAVTRGFEDSGVAPATAINRGEILNSVRSSEEEVGLRYAVTSSLTLLAGAFDVEKPYVALDSHNVFESLGKERHRGAELSLSGELTPGLHLVAGVLIMTPEVLTTPTAQQAIGSRPIGQPHWTGQLSADYSIPSLPRLSFDGSVGASGNETASVDNRVDVPGYVVVTLGARYKLDLDHHSALLRVEVGNVTNAYSFNVQSDGGISPQAARRVWAYLVIDL
jgi:iron complex outermembrane recepter protein